MATPRQQKVIEVLPGPTRSKADILRAAGYAEATVDKPSQVFNSKGIQDLIAKGEAIGLTDDVCLAVIQKAVQGRDAQLAVNTVWKWFATKYPEAKEYQNQLNVQVNNITYSPAQALDDAFMVIKDAGLTKEVILDNLGL